MEGLQNSISTRFMYIFLYKGKKRVANTPRSKTKNSPFYDHDRIRQLVGGPYDSKYSLQTALAILETP